MTLKASYDAPSGTYYVFDPDQPDVAAVPVTVAEVKARLPADQRETYIASYAPITDSLVLEIAREKLGISTLSAEAVDSAVTLADAQLDAAADGLFGNPEE